MRKRSTVLSLVLTGSMLGAALLSGCSSEADSQGKTVIELVQYKPEAVEVFEQLEEKFNATHDDILLKIDSPNDAMTILKTKFIREDYPDIIGIGGDMNYSLFMDSNILADVSDYEGLKSIKPAYVDILEGLEFVPTEGTYGVPYVANAAGVLYNREMFKEHGWEIPETWSEFMSLCEEIEKEGIQPGKPRRGDFFRGVSGSCGQNAGACTVRAGRPFRLRVQRCLHSLCERRICYVRHRKLCCSPD